MRTFLKATSCLFSLLCAFSISAQNRCAHDTWQQEAIKNIDYSKWLNQVKEDVFSEVDLEQRVTCASPLIIPVAVHYNGNVNTSNVTCLVDKALEQIDVMNEDFGAYNADITNYCNISSSCCEDYPPEVLSQGSCIQFCLASMDHPAGETVVGGYAITVGDYTWTGGIDAPAWAGYMNIFVSDVSPPGFGGTLGVAPLFGGTDPDGNGFYVLASAFGGATGGCTSGTGIDTNGTYNLGRTATHEAGHYFGLEHIFAGCSDGDGIADTPDQSNSNFGCPTVTTSSCTNSSNDCGTPDFWFNFMDYVDDDCMYMFTEGQSQVMFNAASQAGVGTNEAYKSDVTACASSDLPTYAPTYPSGCPSSDVPTAIFSPATGSFTLCPGESISFTDESTGCALTTWAWTFSGAGVSPTTSSMQNPTITVSSSGTLSVDLEVSNAGASSPVESASYTVTVLDASDPMCNDCGSTFTDTGGTGGNYGNGEDETWTFCAPTSQVVELNFSSFDIENNATCTWDVMEVFDGPTISSPSMGAFCGPDLGSAPGGGCIESTGTCITVRFTSDGTVNRGGWEATVNCLSAPTCSDGIQNGNERGIDCGGTCAACGCGDNFTDPGQDCGYANNENVTYTYCAPSGETVTVNFTSFSIENETNCAYDGLTVYDGASDAAANLGTFCGTNAPGGGSITSTNECLTFVFTSDGSVAGDGWDANIVCSVVPVNWKSFDAHLRDEVVVLDWITASEVNNKGFTIERSLDAENFVEIGFVEGKGNSSLENVYRFVDENVLSNKIYYYRLKQVDFDGAFEYSNVRFVRTQAVEVDKNELFVYPNPSNGIIYINASISDEYEIEVFDTSGKSVWIRNIDLSKTEVSIDLSALSKGVYRMKIQGTQTINWENIVIL